MTKITQSRRNGQQNLCNPGTRNMTGEQVADVVKGNRANGRNF